MTAVGEADSGSPSSRSIAMPTIGHTGRACPRHILEADAETASQRPGVGGQGEAACERLDGILETWERMKIGRSGGGRGPDPLKVVAAVGPCRRCSTGSRRSASLGADARSVREMGSGRGEDTQSYDGPGERRWSSSRVGTTRCLGAGHAGRQVPRDVPCDRRYAVLSSLGDCWGRGRGGSSPGVPDARGIVRGFCETHAIRLRSRPAGHYACLEGAVPRRRLSADRHRENRQRRVYQADEVGRPEGLEVKEWHAGRGRRRSDRPRHAREDATLVRSNVRRCDGLRRSVMPSATGPSRPAGYSGWMSWGRSSRSFRADQERA